MTVYLRCDPDHRAPNSDHLLSVTQSTFGKQQSKFVSWLAQ